MKKHKKLVLFASIAVLATSGFKIRENKDSKKLFNTQLESYDDHLKEIILKLLPTVVSHQKK